LGAPEGGGGHFLGVPNPVSPTPWQEEQKTMKSKMREKVRPKMGKIDIDYQKLHDAFFKWQTKPKLTIHGDLYYEVGTPSPPMGAPPTRGCPPRSPQTASCRRGGVTRSGWESSSPLLRVTVG